MSMSVTVFNTWTVGPVVPLSALRDIVSDLLDDGVGGNMLVETLAMIDGVDKEVRERGPVLRFSPVVPGGEVRPEVVGLSCFGD